MAQLIVVEGANRGATIDLKGRVLIGSSEDAGIRLDDRRASPQQLEVVEGDGWHEVQNLDPRHNLLVNGEVVRRRRRLAHGDWISIADTTFVFSDDVPRERKPIELSLHADDLFASRVSSRLKAFDSAEAVLETFEDAEDAPPGRLRGGKHQIATLYRVSTAISSQLQLPLLLDTILDICFEVFPAERGFILLLHDDDRKLRCAASKVRGATSEAPSTDISKSVVREVFQTREAVLSLDLTTDARFQHGHSLAGSTLRGVMCAPLVSDDRVVGVIQLDTTQRERAFDQDDLSLLSAIALQCAVAIENARAYKRRQEYSRSLIYLARATQRLSSFLDRDHIVREAVKSACALLACTKGSLLLLRGRRQRLALVYAVGMGRDLAQRMSESDPQHPFARRVIETGQALLVPDVRQLELDGGDRHGGESQDQRYASQSFLIVPVLAAGETVEAHGRAIGALCVTDKLNRGSFSGNDQEVLQIVASQTGIALANAELYERATVDTLTGVYVRRYFFQKLEVAVHNAHFTKSPLALLMIDLDHFKSVNDTYGHAAGDAVLRRLGRVLKRAVRVDMTCARYGGEEFAIICPGIDPEVVLRVAERVRLAVWQESFKLPGGGTLRRTVSIGAAVLVPDEEPTAFLGRSDAALYAAKHEGRNRVVLAPAEGMPPRPAAATLSLVPEPGPDLEPDPLPAGVRASSPSTSHASSDDLD